MGTIGRTATVASDLPAHGGGRAIETSRYLTNRGTRSDPSGDVLSLREGEREARAASGDEQREECRREATTQRECSCAACQKRAQSHAATVRPSSDSKRHASRPQKVQTASLVSCQHHLYTADLHQMVLLRPIECTALIGTWAISSGLPTVSEDTNLILGR